MTTEKRDTAVSVHSPPVNVRETLFRDSAWGRFALEKGGRGQKA